MKIKTINISAFGSLKNFHLDVSDGFNVIYGDNENGKTTLMAFIKMMFYGSERGSSQISKNIRKKYTPWDGSAMAGSIEFQHSGRNYRLQREFKGSNSTDKIILTDMDLGTNTVAPPDVGVKFFGLSSAAFERSVFIGQFGFPEGDPEGEIGKKLSNIALTGEESVSFETVSGRLTKAKNALMSKNGNAGLYDKNIKAINSLKDDLERSVALHEGYSAAKARIVQGESEIAEMQNKAGKLRQKISAEQDIRNAKKLENLLELKAQLDDLNQSLKLSDGTVADETYVKKLQFCLGKTETAAEKINLKQNEIELIKSGLDATLSTTKEEKEKLQKNLSEKIALTEQEKEAVKNKYKTLQNEEREILFNLSDTSAFRKKLNPILLGLGLGFIVLAVISFFLLAYIIGFSAVASAFVGTIGVVLAVLSFVIRPTDKTAYNRCREKAREVRVLISQYEEKQSELTEEISALKARLEAVNTAISGNTELIEKNRQMLLEKEKELIQLKSALETEKEALLGLFARYKAEFSIEEIKESIEKIALGASKQKELKQQINYILRDVGNIAYEEAERKLSDIKESTEDLSADFDSIKSEYDNLISKISEIKANNAGIKARADEAVSNAKNPEAIKAEIGRITELARSQKEFCDAAHIAIDVLAESYVEVRRSYGSELEKKSADIISKLTGGKYTSMTISKSLDIAVEETEKFGSRDIGYLSSGTADQAYLSLRLALSRLMSGEEALPILMDDALAQYDDNRLDLALRFLKEYSEDNQIILFTCHNFISEKAERLGGAVNKL